MSNPIYYLPETSIVFAPSGGDVVFTPQNLANGAGRISAQWDRGSGAQPGLHRAFTSLKAGAALAVGAQLTVYLVQSYGSGSNQVTGNFGTSDAAVSSIDKLRNLGAPAGVVNADSTSNGEQQVTTFTCFLYARYIQVLWWNALGQTLTNTAGDQQFILTPIPPEIQ